MRVVVGGGDACGGPVAEPVSAQQDEKVQRRRCGLKQSPAFFVGCNDGAWLGLMDPGDRGAQRGRSSGNALQIDHEAPEGFGVVRPRVLAQVLSAPALGYDFEVVARELRRELLAVGFDEVRDAWPRIRVDLELDAQPLLSGLRD